MADAAVLILERNKHNLTEFYDTIFNQCRPEMPSSSMRASIIGAHVADGKEASSTTSSGWPCAIRATSSNTASAVGLVESSASDNAGCSSSGSAAARAQ